MTLPVPAVTPHRKPARPGNEMEFVFQGRQYAIYWFGIACWTAALGYFWSWWLAAEHVISLPAFVLISVVVAWVTLVPAYFIFIFLHAKRMKRTSGQLPPGRIAMVVTKAPSEPFEVVRRTLVAMLGQAGSIADVWLADEDPSPETRRWCAARGVFISSRKGVEAYHRTTWPRRTRCKEGNLAYFYDHHGYDTYDFVAQFDADHVPEPGYLLEVMRPFNDAAVGYVSAPSICDANADESWSARGRLYAEASLHGSLQAGYNNGWAPLCIGSHYAVRTAALRQIGGLGPELAEDHSTTLMMNAAGWRGVHALDAIAHGEGPATFADLAVQEFQWSRSLVTILLQHSRTYVPHLPRRLKFQFLFSQVWYPMFSGFMAVCFALPVVALLSGEPFVNVTYPDFFFHIAPLSFVLIALAFFWRRTGTFRPSNARIFGWEGVVFMFIRWPWSLAGSLAALRDHLSGSFVDFRITPKGDKGKQRMPVRILVPYALLGGVSAAAMVLAPDSGQAPGFFIFAGMNAAIYAGVMLLIIARHAYENGLPAMPRMRMAALSSATAVAILGFSGLELRHHGTAGVEALANGLTVISVTETKFAVAGAGRGGKNLKITTFRLKWNGFAGHAPASSAMQTDS